MSYWRTFPDYVPVAKRRAQAQREVGKLRKKNRAVTPIVIEGRKITSSVWGRAWCDNLERYADFENRLPRGRSYVRNGAVIDLTIERGQVKALVSGSEVYKVKVDVAVAAKARWSGICRDCAGSVGSLVELLQGRLSTGVMERVCREGDGLFPAPKEITMSCSCPDWADMCKHVAAVLYGIGARLDAAPELLFTLRGVDHADLVANAGADLPQSGAASGRILADGDLASVFGLELDAPAVAAPSAAKHPAAAARTNPVSIPKATARPSRVKAAATGPAGKPGKAPAKSSATSSTRSSAAIRRGKDKDAAATTPART
jgi:uncharacterized Zn finger protein